AGTDHAGIATQAVVEKRVMKEEKKRRTDFSREDFVAKIQAFKDEYEATITNQLKKTGCSCDWDRQRFTMDDQCAAAVREAFFILFRDGLIYRGKRLVNWDPVLQTAVADDECYDEEIDGNFYYLRYPLVHALALEPGTPHAGFGKGHTHDVAPRPVTWDELAARGYPDAESHPGDQQAWLTVATTRPETYLGDTAVAINPHDPRAKALRGIFAELPLVGRVIPIIEDSYVVLPERYARDEEEKNDPKAKMATGFLKVTPAHDPNDYEIGQRHKLNMINIFSPDGKISDKHGFSDVGDAHLLVGLPREKARAKVVEEFKARDLFEGSKPTRHSVKHSDRSKAIIEPYLSDQWYVKVTDPRMAKAANEALVSSQRTTTPTNSTNPTRERGPTSTDSAHRAGSPASSASTSAHAAGSSGTEGSLTFFPERYAKSYEHWHDNIRDWCISRQLWWGHRIPVWSTIVDGTRSDFNDGADSPVGHLISSDVDEMSLDEGNYIARLVDTSTGEVFHPTYDSEDLVNFVRGRHVKVYVCVRDENRDKAFLAHLENWGGLERDPDVLDTWFSSALWPLSTLGWPDPTKFNAALNKGLLEAFNPSQTLCTAREIITLWVSRMVMFNGYLKGRGTGTPAFQAGSGGAADKSTSDTLAHLPGLESWGTRDVPFHHVFIHAVIQDGEGRKMSKSLGNGVDPLDIIATHGADAMRFTLCHMATNTQDVRLPVKKDANGNNTSEKFDLGRNFATKLWNAARFALSMIGSRDEETKTRRDEVSSSTPTTSSLNLSVSSSLLDRWMLSRLAAGSAAANAALENYEFHEYAQALYDLLWRDFCDWYLEGVKPTIASNPSQQAVLGNALSAIVRMLHPVMPYVTETLWEHMGKLQLPSVSGVQLTHTKIDALNKKREATGLLVHQAWPAVASSLRDEKSEARFDRLRALVTAIRDVRAAHQVKPSARIALQVPKQLSEFVMDADIKPLLMTFAGLESVSLREGAKPEGVAFTFESVEFFIPGIGGSKETESARVAKQVAELEKSVATLEGRLNNPGYTDRAPPHMVQQTRDELAKKKQELDAAKAALAKLG
ncbi:MAG: class I tRNA ligase family protein, partial [Phycisphaerales bacterium]